VLKDSFLVLLDAAREVGRQGGAGVTWKHKSARKYAKFA